jgi:uncharacterized protein YgbK (DUF1537 family)
MGVVADDITGANDIGIMFAKSGYLTYVYSYSGPGSYRELSAGHEEPDICILDTNSRLDAPRVAYEKVYAATRDLQETGCQRFFNKTCSVFRGNIGAEFDAMLDALGESFAIVVLGFPKNGRTTVDGVHYVHGVRLEESEFKNDPIHPMTKSNLVEILSDQTRRKVANLNHEWVGKGAEALNEKIHAMQAECNYLILDVVNQESLRTIAAAVRDFPVICGSSALAEELPHAWGGSGREPGSLNIATRDGVGILCVAGSLMPQTAAQIHHLVVHGRVEFDLNPANLFDADTRHLEIGRLVGEITEKLLDGEDVVFHSSNKPDTLDKTDSTGARFGLSKTEVSRLVSGTIAEVAVKALENSGQNRLVVAGGETSAAVCARLGVNGMLVWKEIQPGLPSCLTLSTEPLLLVLKSGSFGSPDFFERALEHLRSQ